jgi:copper chaperone CopZ
VDGVHKVETDIQRHTVNVVYDHNRVTVQKLVDALQERGMTVQGYGQQQSKRDQQEQRSV